MADPREQVREAVLRILSEQLGVPRQEIEESSTLATDLGADELDVVQLTMALEEEFDVDVPDEDGEKLLTVGQLVDHLTAKTAKARA